MKRDATILVTGGTGFLGSYLLRQLLASGYTNIRATRRVDSRMDLVADIRDRIEWVDTDVLDVVGLYDAMSSVDALYHCAAVVSFDPRDKRRMYRVNVEGTAHVVNAALEAGVGKMVFVSSIAAIGRVKGREKVTEDLKWDGSKLNSAYARSKYLAEKEVWRGIGEGLNAVIINPAVILGSGRWQEGPAKLFLEVYRGLRFYPVGSTGFVDVRDVADLMIRMMASDVSGRRFIANGANVTYRQAFADIAAALGVSPPAVPFVAPLRALAWRVEWLRTRLFGGTPLITRETMRTSMHRFYYDNTLSREVFQFRYRPFEETVRETAEKFLLSQADDFRHYPLEIGS